MGLLDQLYVDAIKGFEGYRDTPYWDYKQYTSGFGTKAASPDEKIDPATADQRLNTALDSAAATVDAVNPNLPPGARAALISLTYNAGPGWAKSGLGDLVRSGDLQGAQERLLQYNRAGGQVNPGLVARRQQEASWFGNSPAPSVPPLLPAGPPLSLTPPSPPTQAAPPLQVAQQQPQPSYWNQIPAEQMPTPPPIFYAPRKTPVQLARIAPGFFNRG